MKRNGLTDNTIKPRIDVLHSVSRICNITNPEQVKTALTELTWKESTKKTFISNYTQFLKTINLTWKAPRCKPAEKLPFIPMETEVDQLIASTGKKMATLLQFLKETGTRIGEATQLKWKDLNTEQRTINITPEKGSNPRILPLSPKLIDMLNQIPRTRETIFSTNIDALRESFCNQRNTATVKLGNPRLKYISFHTLRHFKGTMEYHKTKDILHVKYILGHKRIESTMVYINIDQATFLTETDEWTSKIANTPEEACKLIEANFTHVCNMGEKSLFKKRK